MNELHLRPSMRAIAKRDGTKYLACTLRYWCLHHHGFGPHRGKSEDKKK